MTPPHPELGTATDNLTFIFQAVHSRFEYQQLKTFLGGNDMAANKQQGQSFGLFLVGLTVLCVGLIGGGFGKAAIVIGLVILAAAFFLMFKIKPLEGKPASGLQPSGMKLLGAIVALLGWVVVLFGLHISSGVGGRMVITIVGILISLAGSLVILPAACNKNAIWKA
jgi:hypothetical protein